jgi:O-succinylbenzoate synthase
MADVKIHSVDIFRFQLVPDKRIPSGHQNVDSRTGLLLKLKTSEGAIGWGETSPLPGTSQETIFEAELQWHYLAQQLTKQDISASHPYHQYMQNLLKTEIPLSPSVRTGMDMALWDLLHPSSGMSIPVNALLHPSPRAQDILRLLDMGYKSLKFKIGRQSVKEEQSTIRLIQDVARGRATLRLDANRAWSIDAALNFLSELDPKGIEYIEEPLQSLKDYPLLLKKLTLPIALDESLQRLSPLSPLLTRGIEALILKPTLLGGVHTVHQWIKVAERTNKKWILSHCFESPVAVSHFISWAHHWKGHNRSMGLDASTLSQCPWLKHTIKSRYGRVSSYRILDKAIKEKHLEWIQHVSS